MSGLKVAVAGGGLAGLCLAQGLLKAGVDVTVYERDTELAARRQGYRLHVDAWAGLALEQCLPPESFAVFQATCGEAGTRLTVLSERLRVLSEQQRADSAGDPYAPATMSTSVNRQTLREVLAAGLGDRLVFGCELTSYELAGHEAGRDGVRLHFAGGRQAEADLLVGADGVHSAVRRQYLPPPPRTTPARGASTARPRCAPGSWTGCRARCGAASPPWSAGRSAWRPALSASGSGRNGPRPGSRPPRTT